MADHTKAKSTKSRKIWKIVLKEVCRLLLIKVGKKEHIELLQQGSIHLNPLSRFRNDGTAYRGDVLEGTYRVDTSRGIFINGVDISKFGTGLEVTQSYQHSDDILIFCAAVLDGTTTIKKVKDGEQFRELNPVFLEELKKFGTHAVMFRSEHLAASLSNYLKSRNCNYGHCKVEYIDKWDFEAVGAYIRRKEAQLGDEAIYFLKDIAYKSQNEWRFLIECFDDISNIVKNQDGSLDVMTAPFPTSDIIELG